MASKTAIQCHTDEILTLYMKFVKRRATPASTANSCHSGELVWFEQPSTNPLQGSWKETVMTSVCSPISYPPVFEENITTQTQCLDWEYI